MTGWQNMGPERSDPNGSPAQPPWDPGPEYGQHPTPSPYVRQPHPPRRKRPIPEHDDYFSIPDKRGKGMYVVGAACGVVVLLMVTAIVLAVSTGGTGTPSAVNSSVGSPVYNGGGSTGGGGTQGPSDSSSGTDGGPGTFTLLHGLQGYKLWTGPEAEQQATTYRKSIDRNQPQLATIADSAKYGVYRKGQDLILVMAQTSANPDVATMLKTDSPAKAADTVLGTVSAKSAKAFPAGPKGGALRCLPKVGRTGPAVRCAWADSATLVSIEGKLTESAMARFTLAYRNAAEP